LEYQSLTRTKGTRSKAIWLLTPRQHAINEALEAGWQGPIVAAKFPLAEIAQAHESVEHPTKAGRTIVTI
jgi:hypothetical protein